METDRTFEIVNLRNKIAWGENFPQIDDCQRSVCHGIMALTDANLAFMSSIVENGETAQPMRQKTIQGTLSRFPWSQTTLIFDGFFAPQAPIFLKLPISSGLSVSMLSDPRIHPQGSRLGGLIGSVRA